MTTATEIQKSYGVSRETAEQMVPAVQLEIEVAQRKWVADLPALKLKAREAYDAAFAKGGNNAHKRATCAARAIWSGF